MATGHADNKENAYMINLEERLEKNPNDIEALIHKAVMLYEPYHQFDHAEIILTKVRELFPQSIEGLLWSGALRYFIYGNDVEAAEYFRQALTLDPNAADSHAFLAVMLESIKNIVPGDIEYHYRKSFELEPTFINPRLYLARYLFEQGNLKVARYELLETLKFVEDPPSSIGNPVTKYYESYITGRCWTNRKQEILDFIQKIDVAEAAVKIDSKDS